VENKEQKAIVKQGDQSGNDQKGLGRDESGLGKNSKSEVRKKWTVYRQGSLMICPWIRYG
jgi:hypothetical protein